MLGIIWYRAKVLAVLRDDFGYEPKVPGWQAPIFNSITKELRKQKGNPYDSAVAFLTTQLEAVKGSNDPEVRLWVKSMTKRINEILPLCSIVRDSIFTD